MKKARILFFLPRGRWTDELRATAETVRRAVTGAEVVLCPRNSTAAGDGDSNPEPCDYVAGDVPSAYAARFSRITDDGTIVHAAAFEAAQPEMPSPFGDSSPKAAEAGTIAAEVGSVGSWTT